MYNVYGTQNKVQSSDERITKKKRKKCQVKTENVCLDH